MAVPLGTVLTPSAALGVPQRAPRLSAGVPSARPQSRRPPRAGVVAGWGRRAAPCAFTGVIARSHGRVCLRGRVDSAGRPSGCGDAAPEPAVRAGGTGVSVPAPVRGRRPWAAGFTPRKPQTPESGLLRPSEACLALPGARPPLSPQLTGVCGHHRLRPPPAHVRCCVRAADSIRPELGTRPTPQHTPRPVPRGLLLAAVSLEPAFNGPGL